MSTNVKTAKENKGLYEVRNIVDLRDMIDQSKDLFGKEAAFKLRNKDGSYRTVSFNEFHDDITALGTALASMGLQGKHIAIMGDNSYKWCVSYLAIGTGVGVIVPIDRELPFEDVETIIKESETSCLIIDKKHYAKFLLVWPQLIEETGIKIILMEEIEGEDVLVFDEVVDNGRKMAEAKDVNYVAYRNNPIDPDAMAVIIFTSGTSGRAKGVMLSQRNLCFVVMSNSMVAKTGPGDVFLDVLPLHHTFECSLGFLEPVYNGVCNAFNTSLLRLQRDMQEVQPTIIFTVPLLVEKLHDKILKTVEKEGKQQKFEMGKKIGNVTNKLGMKSVNRKLFKDVHEQFGGNMRLFIIGAAGIKPEAAADFNLFGIGSYLGYGLTECAPLVSCNHDKLMTFDTVGEPIPGVEIKIIDMNEEGIGEVCVKGPNVMLGYYKNEEATKEVIDEDGWLHTGDLGLIDDRNCLKLTGRAKNVIVTRNGKNIYPEELEDKLNRNPFIAESMVVGNDDDEEEGTVVEAKIFPDLKAIDEYLKSRRKDTPENKEKAENEAARKEEIEKIIKEVVKEINKLLPSYKNIRQVTVREQEFIKTTTQKVKRYANMDNDKVKPETEEKAEAETKSEQSVDANEENKEN